MSIIPPSGGGYGPGTGRPKAHKEFNLPGWLLIVEFVVIGALAAWAAKRFAGLPWLPSAIAGMVVFVGLMSLLYKTRWFFWVYLAIVTLVPALIFGDFMKFHVPEEWAWASGIALALVSGWAHWAARSEIYDEDETAPPQEPPNG
ncbi:hypothetical protein [Rhodobium gokarnense]|uniref:SPW repeat-containing protein n=1 Tax=Rhodobium gokarnense TaxID=364296 RepID=A0ABT3H6Y5_9HYPH|nr:hypothetical protein [Rhodobium gokarnense]MCW2306150.1 hypothetical protein [Rhodobium gokarnense]